MIHQFQTAVPVWHAAPQNEWNQFIGFRCDLALPVPTELRIALAARNWYRLYINGAMVAHGPAQTARNHCRIDEIVQRCSGSVAIAIEVAALSIPSRYANDYTMEPGILCCEISSADGTVLSATGDDSWRCAELNHRLPMVPTMSHCRGIIEVYQLDSHSYDWRTGPLADIPAPTGENISWLPRRAPYASYCPIPLPTLMQVSDLRPVAADAALTPPTLAMLINHAWYQMLPPEANFVPRLKQEGEQPFTGRMRRSGDSITLQPGQNAPTVTWSMRTSEVGFLHIRVEASADTVLDLIHSDHLEEDGSLPANDYVSRYTLAPGCYDLISFDPLLVRYVRVIARTAGEITLSRPEVLDYSYPDDGSTGFECSDGELNALYDAARRTARLNTSDIYMDCPERERGGWLCDSVWTSRADWMYFGDAELEKGFLENFMKTTPEQYRNAWFPEVFPSSPRGNDPGIETWAGWLIPELYEYYHRSGDRAFIDEIRPRIEAFVDGMLNNVYDPEVGLFTHLKTVFVDWSLSNSSFNTDPISVPANVLFCKDLRLLAELYDVPAWAEKAEQVLTRLREALYVPSGPYAAFAQNSIKPSDALSYADGRFSRSGCTTEAALATELWCGFNADAPALIREFVEAMGTHPLRVPDPNLGRANLFIGLAIRHDVLAQLGRIDQLLRELKGVYLPQLAQGSGTFFESIHASSGCHGFNAHVGSLILQNVLGLGEPHHLDRSIRIAPHPADLRWAQGNAHTRDGDISLRWTADHETQVLHLRCDLPDGWTAELIPPKNWTIQQDL